MGTSLRFKQMFLQERKEHPTLNQSTVKIIVQDHIKKEKKTRLF